jgi:L-fucose mutarotase
MKTLMEMGHGDEIVLADGNFPAASCANRLIRSDGHGIPDLLDSMINFFPLDTYVKRPVALMNVQAGDPEPPVWEQYRTVLRDESGHVPAFDLVERFAFYERAKKAYAIVATGERALYANIILKKGVVES